MSIKYVEYMRQDVSTRTMQNLRKRYHIAFRRWLQGKSGGGPIAKYIGASPLEVKGYIGSWMLPEMNWNNYGDVWVIDHIAPVRLFDMTNESDLSLCWHYKNIMPLLRKDNLYKEGDIRFSLLLLEKLVPCNVTYALYQRLIEDIKRMDKYLEHCPIAIAV